MSETMERDSSLSEHAGVDTSTNVLQATFKHYFEMALDHHTKAATTSNFLLVIVGAILTIISFDQVIGGTIDIVSSLAVFVLGLFGAVWTWKQLELI